MANEVAVSVVIGAALGKNYFSTFDTAQQKSVKLGEAYQATNKKLNAANGVIKYRELLNKLEKKQQAAGGSNKRLAAGIKDVERRYKDAKKAAKAYGISVGSVVQEQRQLNQQTQRLETNMKRVNNQLESQNKLAAIRGKALGLLGAAYAASRNIGNAFEVEDKELQLGDVITGQNAEQRLAQSIASGKAFARNSLASETDVLEIDYSLRSSGLDDEAAMFGKQIVSKVATVTKGSTSEVGFIIGDTFMNMGKSMEGSVEQKLTRIGDVLTKTKNLFSIKDFNQLGEGLKEALPAALANNISLEQTAALIGQINNGMLKGSQSGTGFTALFRQLPKASEELGFDIVRNENGEMDALATLQLLKDSLSYIDDIDERSVLLQNLFGDEGKKGLMPILASLEDLNKNFKEVNENADGTVDEGYQRRLESAGGQWRMFTQNITMVGSAFATTLLPAINTVLKPMGQVMGLAADFINEFPLVGKIIGGIAAGVGLYGAALGIVTAAQWAWNAAMLANPIGLTIAAIGAAAAIVVHYWEPISSFFTGIWDGIIDGATKAIDWVLGKFAIVGNAIASVKSALGFGDDDADSSNVVPMANYTPRSREPIVGAAVAKAANDAKFLEQQQLSQGNLALKPAPQAAPQINEENNYQIQITQQPGEDANALTKKVIAELDRRQQRGRRRSLYDE